MTKLWCIAIAMGGPEDGMVVVSTQMSGLQEMAVAQAVSDVYRQTGTKLPLMGVNARELTREYLEAALRAMDEDEQKPAGVVQLVPAQFRPQAEVVAQALGQPKEATAGLDPRLNPMPGAGKVFNGQFGAATEKLLDDQLAQAARDEMIISEAPPKDEPA